MTFSHSLSLPPCAYCQFIQQFCHSLMSGKRYGVDVGINAPLRRINQAKFYPAPQQKLFLLSSMQKF